MPFAVQMQLPITQHYITFWTILTFTKRVKEAVSSIWGPISWGSQRLFYRSFRKIKRILPCPVSQRPIKHERDPLAMDSHLTTKCMAGYFTLNLFSCLLPHFIGDRWNIGTIYLAKATAKNHICPFQMLKIKTTKALKEKDREWDRVTVVDGTGVQRLREWVKCKAYIAMGLRKQAHTVKCSNSFRTQ